MSTPSADHRIMHALTRALLGLGTFVLVLVSGVLCFALFPPSELLRRAAVPVLRDLLHHPRLDLGALVLRPLQHIELRDLWLGPPAGYEQPMLTIRRIVVRYDVRALPRAIRVAQVQVDRPVVRLESRNGKPNWLAFLEGLPQSEPTPEEPASPSALQIWLDRVAIVGLAAHVDDGQHQVTLDSLHLGVWGLVSSNESRLHLALELEGRGARQPSLALLRREASGPVGLSLDAGLQLGVRLSYRPTLRADLRPDVRAKLALGLQLASRRILAPWPLAPLELRTRLVAEAQTLEDFVRLERLEVNFNRSELLKLGARLRGVFKPRQLELALERLHLPLDLFAPYLRVAVPGVDLGGQINVQNVRARAELDRRTLPALRGDVSLEKVWATVERPGLPALALGALDARLALRTTPQLSQALREHQQLRAALPAPTNGVDAVAAEQGELPPVFLAGWLRLGRAQGFGAELRELDLRWNAGAHVAGVDLGGFATRLALRLPQLSYRHPTLGALRLGLETQLAASGDWPRQDFELERLRFALGDLLKLELKARAEQRGERSLQAQLRLEPLDLARLLRQAPSGVRQRMAGLAASGRVGLSLSVAGRLPAALLRGEMPLTPPQLVRLPVTLNAQLNLEHLGASAPRQALALSGLDGTLALGGRPSDLQLTGKLVLGQLSKSDQQLSVRGLELPLELHFRPRQLELELGLAAAELVKRDAGLAVRGLKTSTKLSSALPPLAQLLAGGLRPGRTELQLGASLGEASLSAPGNRLRAGPLIFESKVNYDPAQQHAVGVELQTRLGALQHAEQGARLRDLELTGHFTTTLQVPRLLAGQSVRLGRTGGELGLALKGFALSSPGASLQGNALRTKLKLDVEGARTKLALESELGSLESEQQAAGLRGLHLKVQSTVRGPVLELPAPQTQLDEISSQLELALESVHKAGLRTMRNSSLVLEAACSRLRDIEVRKLALRVPTPGLYLDLSGKLPGLLPLVPGKLPVFDVRLAAGVRNPSAQSYGGATMLLPELRIAGQLGVALGLSGRPGNQLAVDGRLLAESFSLWAATDKVEQTKDGASLASRSRLHVRDLDASLPIAQRVSLAGRSVQLPRPTRSVFARQAAGVLYQALRPYGGRRSALSVGGVTLEQQTTARDARGHVLSTVQRRNRVDRLTLDLALAENALLLDRFYVKLFDGDIAGGLQAQLLALNGSGPPDLRLRLNTQITGVNLGYLDPAVKRPEAKTEVSALVDLQYELCRQALEGRIRITRISLDTLDSLLAFLDPNGLDKNVQENRKLLKSWYVKMVNPKVKLVSIWINYGNLNLDIEMDAMEPVGSLLGRILKQNRIRRLNIRPRLPECPGREPGLSDEENGL